VISKKNNRKKKQRVKSLPNYIKIKLLIGDCGFYINEIEGMYLDVMGRNLLKKSYHERNIILAQSNVLRK
jgi:hypothetical protein